MALSQEHMNMSTLLLIAAFREKLTSIFMFFSCLSKCNVGARFFLSPIEALLPMRLVSWATALRVQAWVNEGNGAITLDWDEAVTMVSSCLAARVPWWNCAADHGMARTLCRCLQWARLTTIFLKGPVWSICLAWQHVWYLGRLLTSSNKPKKKKVGVESICVLAGHCSSLAN